MHGIACRITDENTIRRFRNRMIETGTLKRVMKAFDWQLHKKGYIPMSGQIVDATLVPAPKQTNTEDEKAAIKDGKTAEEIWPDQPNKAAQKDTNARFGCLGHQCPLVGSSWRNLHYNFSKLPI